MRCHTWPPAASDPHLGVRATKSEPPSPAPGWHVLIHETAWALSAPNYPYQSATIHAFINPTSERGPFSLCFFLENNNNNNKTNPPLQMFFCVCVFRSRSSKHPDFLGTSIRPSAPNGSGSPPRCWWAWPLTYWPKTLLMWAAPGCLQQTWEPNLCRLSCWVKTDPEMQNPSATAGAETRYFHSCRIATSDLSMQTVVRLQLLQNCTKEWLKIQLVTHTHTRNNKKNDYSLY